MPPRQHRSFHRRKQLATVERLEDRRLLAVASQAEYMPLYLASDQANQALLQDPNLVNPWGIDQRISNHQGPTSGPTEGSFSIADHGTGAISQFGGNVNGNPLAPAATISVPGGSPLGVVGIPVLGNGSNQNYGFTLTNGSSSAPADFLFAGGGGRISGWNPNVSVNSAELGAIAANSNFTGLAFGSVAQIGPVIYAADFQNNRIVVFNSSFQLVPQNGTFIDPDLPAGEAPYNIMNLNGTLFVAYARQAPGGQAPITGQGYGVIDAFRADGAFIGRVTTSGPGIAGSYLDAPWGMAIAPSSFSQYGGDLLVANTGNGQINAFSLQNLSANPSTLPDNYVGTLLDPSDHVLTIDGLRGLSVGNDVTAGDSSTVYFTAGPNNATHGLFGSLTSINNNSGVIGVPLVAAGGQFLAGFNAPFSGTVATFSDVYGQDTGVNPFTTMINWGDGTISAGSVRQVGPNQYLVQGAHTYTVTGAYNVTVAIADSHSNTATVSSIAAVTPTSGGGLAATGVNLSAQPGASFNGVVANFTDAGGSTLPSAYTAAINWGDGAASTGTVSAKGTGFQVSGQHVYANAGSNTVTIVIRDANGNSVTTTATATIANGALNATAVPVAATEGVAFNGAVAAFTNSDKSLPANDFSAAIAWGDGASTSGTVSGQNGQFSVSGSHVYTDIGNYTAHVAIVQTGGGASAAVAVPVHVADAPLTFSGVPFTAKVGATFSGAVATFADANPLAKSSDFTAAIQWGDGAATTGAVTGTGPFTVTGMHAYTAGGNYTVTTSIRDVGGSTVSGTTSAIVSQYPLIGSPVSISGTEGLTFSGNVATFTDTNPGGGTPGSYTASINWGDGATTSGIISGSAGNYTVSGTHVFTDVVSAVTVVIDVDGSPAATIESPATIADANVLSGTANSVAGIVGVPLLAPLATFHDVYTASPASDFEATIAWGDGAMTAGTVSGQNGVFTVRGNHVYTQVGMQTAVVTLRDKPPGTASASVSVPVTISDAPLVASNYTFHPAPSSTYHGVVATFNDVNQTAPATDFTATIAWDDGTIDTGNVVAAGGGLFNVIDTHSFGPAGSTAQATVTVRSSGGAEVTMQSTAIVTAGGSATTPDERWVNALFQDLLNRPAGSAALTYFGAMAAANRGQVVSDIVHSDEYSSDQVRALYEHYLHRPADAGGLSYFVGQLRDGAGVRQVALDLASSPEFFATQGGGTTNGFLNALFEDILDRPIGADAEQFFGQQLASGTSRGTIVADIMSSPEHLADIVNAEYHQLLSRPADPGAMNYWTAYLQRGLHRDGIVVGIGQSAEFYARAT